MRPDVYLDTSSLVKWYINEPFSEEVEAFIQEKGPVAVSSLTVTEMRSLLARRYRMNEMDAEIVMKVWATFMDDLRQGFVVRIPFTDTMFDSAAGLLATMTGHGLRTLDALHLAFMKEESLESIATSDRIMADAAQSLNFEVVRFGC